MSLFNAELWSREIMQTFQRSAPTELDPRSVWAPTGETYAEALAWARLAGVSVTQPGTMSPLRDSFALSRPGRVPKLLPLCSPGDLIDEIRKFATP
jgi:hypothetical protein